MTAATPAIEPFAVLKEHANGFYAIAVVGMKSGPWSIERAQKIVDAWNGVKDSSGF